MKRVTCAIALEFMYNIIVDKEHWRVGLEPKVSVNHIIGRPAKRS